MVCIPTVPASNGDPSKNDAAWPGDRWLDPEDDIDSSQRTVLRETYFADDDVEDACYLGL